MTDQPATPAGATRIARYGEGAWLVSFEEAASTRTARRAQALGRALVDAAVTRVPVAGVASVLVPFDPSTEEAMAVRARIDALLDGVPADPEPPLDALVHDIQVRYAGPDLTDVAQATGLSTSDVVERHSAVTYEVLALGFAPGFAYLGELDPSIRVPRLATPRERVPAGSVAIADALTAVYPSALPGGWRILGHTDQSLFDPTRTDPATFRPGDRVRFVADR